MSFDVVLAGKIGDIIYELAAVSRLAADRNDRARVYLLCQDGVSLTDSEARLLLPLIESQHYVESAGIVDGSPGEGAVLISDWFMDYDHRRNILVDMFCRLGLEPAGSTAPWLVRDAAPNGLTLVNRTGRYPNFAVDWRTELERFPDACFVGRRNEHDEFQNLVRRKVCYIETPSLCDLADLIAGCTRLLANQSSPLAIAHGMGKPVVVETSTDCPNCIFHRPNAKYLGVDMRFVEDHGY